MSDDATTQQVTPDSDISDESPAVSTESEGSVVAEVVEAQESAVEVEATEAAADEATIGSATDEVVEAAEEDEADEALDEGEIAADYLEGLLDIADLDGDIDITVENDRPSLSVIEVNAGDLAELVGQDGKVLSALQDLTRLAVTRETGQRSRLMLDIAGHRATRRSELQRLAQRAITEVKETGEPARMSPMTAFERKVVHDEVAAAGLTSESEGAEPQRYVVITPA